MDDELRFLAEKVLKAETNTFLKAIDRLMDEDGVGKLLKKEHIQEKDIEEGHIEEKHRKKEAKEGKTKGIPGRTQFKMLMDATGKASSTEELLLFLAYQKSKKNGWEAKCDNGFQIAENVAASLMKVQDEIYSMIETKAGTEKIGDGAERLLKLKIAEKYMGYLYWKASAVGRFEEEK